MHFKLRSESHNICKTRIAEVARIVRYNDFVSLVQCTYCLCN